MKLTTESRLVMLLSLAMLLLLTGASARGDEHDTHPVGTVYITENPLYFHLWECKRLVRPRAIGIEEALTRRLEPCETCKPPTSVTELEALAATKVRATPAPAAKPAQRVVTPPRTAPQPAPHPSAPETMPAPGQQSRVEAGGLSDLHQRHLLVLGETVYVSSGQTEHKGSLQRLNSHGLTIQTGDGPLTFGEHEIDAIRVKRGDSVANGLIAGAATGAGLGVASGVAVCEDREAGCIAAFGAFYGLIGMGLGALIDHGVQGSEEVYHKGAGDITLRLAPTLHRDTIGVVMQCRF